MIAARSNHITLVAKHNRHVPQSDFVTRVFEATKLSGELPESLG